MDFTKSRALQEKSHALIPGGAHTYAKGDEVLLFLRHQLNTIGDLLGLAYQMSQACLSSFRGAGVVTRIAVGNEVASEGTSEDGNGDV